LGTSALIAEVMLSESVLSKAEEAVVSLVAVVMADLRLSTAMTRLSDCNNDPSYAVTSLVSVATSEEMVEMALRTVVASRRVRGREVVRVEVRRTRRDVVSCILVGYRQTIWS
jgi:hypothetical protein